MSIKKLIIIGAGNFGREMLAWSLASELFNNWKVFGFIDDDLEALNGYNVGYPIVSTINEYLPKEDDVFICSINNPNVKLEVCEKLKSIGAKFINIIHPMAIVGPNCTIGEGVILCPFSMLTSHVNLGNYVTINAHSTIGHDAVLGDGCTLSGHCDITGFAHLEKGVFMGSGSRILPKAHIGEYAFIGAGSVVLRKVKAKRKVFGIPAQYID
ncbi:sugar O-acyltransferase (sialic acid O-acetyltransferase NeuD family) [Paenibacillus castaneae]|uniref:acetyltransferase n=1 Tax=Paenibacillus castaneae TaxID=474957 RepID=UPI000C9B34D2|nr:acetyltransferase [Paenibacillus castaneae]NIK76087.1 sugar O-acyltransferase (sialic acid O-acetyltransferase NeuD family) [Paenibacillus castaneae]